MSSGLISTIDNTITNSIGKIYTGIHNKFRISYRAQYTTLTAGIAAGGATSMLAAGSTFGFIIAAAYSANAMISHHEGKKGVTINEQYAGLQGISAVTQYLALPAVISTPLNLQSLPDDVNKVGFVGIGAAISLIGFCSLMRRYVFRNEIKEL